MKFTQIPADTFEQLQLNAGVIASAFTPESGTLTASNIIGATSGGVSFTSTPTYKDFGEDIDNCPKNTKELKKIDGYDVKLSGTLVTVTSDVAKRLVGAAGVSGGEAQYALTSDTSLVTGKTYYTRSGSGTAGSPYVYTPVQNPSAASLSTYYEVTGYSTAKVTPRADLASADFADIWWIGDYSDKNGATNGGFVAIRVINGLSTGGFQLQSSDKEKGKFAFEFTGHTSMATPSVVPFEVYVKAGTAES